MAKKEGKLSFPLRCVSPTILCNLFCYLHIVCTKGIIIEDERDRMGNPITKMETSTTQNKDEIPGYHIATNLRGSVNLYRALDGKESFSNEVSSCVSDDGEVGISWSGKQGDGSSLSSWVTGGSFSCTKSCQDTYQNTDVSESGYAKCVCGPNSNPPVAPMSIKKTCVSDGGHVDFSFFLKVGESGAVNGGNFCCSNECVDEIGGSALTFVPVKGKDGEPIFEDGEPVFERWGDRFDECICG